ncbi:MAG: hypothetical protein K1X29_06910 [Bdellovibrionales bacterium]|nr:hypothetical protein [Bdellovibrionales bacterium]
MSIKFVLNFLIVLLFSSTNLWAYPVYWYVPPDFNNYTQQQKQVLAEFAEKIIHTSESDPSSQLSLLILKTCSEKYSADPDTKNGRIECLASWLKYNCNITFENSDGKLTLRFATIISTSTTISASPTAEVQQPSQSANVTCEKFNLSTQPSNSQ